MRALLFCAALLCGLPCFAAPSCDVRVPTETQVVGDVRLAYQSIGRPTDPALLLVMGVGGQLIAHVAERAKKAGYPCVILQVNKRNVNAINSYQKYGFVVREVTVDDIGHGYVMDDYVMEKKL